MTEQGLLGGARLARPAAMGRISSSRRRRWAARGLTPVLAALALVAADGREAGPLVSVAVHGYPVRVEAHATVRHALAAAGATPRDGRLLSAATRTVLDPHADPARLEIDGRPVAPGDEMVAGDDVTIIDGVDRVEALELRRIELPPPALPAVERQLWRPGQAGLGEAVVGVLSGEAVSRRTLQPPVPPAAVVDPLVALTFDDGPHPTWTPMVLDILRDEQVPATFCVVGELVRRHPALVRRIRDEGHVLCNHTEHHATHLDRRPRAEVEAEVAAGSETIRASAGVQPLLYRPPGGLVSPDVVAVAHAAGQRVLHWTVDPQDYRFVPPPP
ncbi:MAG TPA: polysaccharide deacetylase family protein, partial [Egibacteraceae bacterium]|nr:polysaccharide deacetylase family protein [Egibacteraceae bacterium]